MKPFYHILIAGVIGLATSPIQAQCTGNACYITFNNTSITKIKPSNHLDISLIDTDIHISTFLLNLPDRSQYCQMTETLVIMTKDTFQCVTDISTWVEV